MAVNITPYGWNEDSGFCACDVYHARVDRRNEIANKIREIRGNLAQHPEMDLAKKLRLTKSLTQFMRVPPKPTKKQLLKEAFGVLQHVKDRCPYNICGQDDAWYESRAANIAEALAKVQAAFEYARE